MEPYERFDAFKRADELAQAVYRVTGRWPKDERFGLIAEIRRSARSVPTNIVEGTTKFGPRELRRYLDISLGSLSEVRYLLRLARNLGYMSSEEWASIDCLGNRAGKLIWLLHKSLGPREKARAEG